MRSKLVAAAVGAASVLALVVMLARKDKRPSPPALPEPDSVAEPAAPEPSATEPVEPVDEAPEPTTPPLRVAAPVPPAPVPPAPVPPPAEPDAGAPLSEEALLTQLHDLAASDPSLSLKLGREAVERFPHSPNAPEFEWNVVKALFNMGRMDDAENEARVMLWKYPDSSFTGDVVHHLLNHPPNPPGTP